MSTMVATEPEVMPKAEVTPEELLAMPDGGHYELIDGELKERRVSFLSNLVAAEVTGILRDHCRSQNIGWILAAELGYRCFPWKPRRIRRADVSFFGADRVTKERLSEGFCTIAPDLAVEVVSPNDLIEELDEKVAEYLRAGVKLVWVVRPGVHAVQVFRADGSESWLRASDELSGEDVIPGFRCRVEAFFPMLGQPEEQSPKATGADAPSS
jgi:Uma2 family endonuclease